MKIVFTGLTLLLLAGSVTAQNRVEEPSSGTSRAGAGADSAASSGGAADTATQRSGDKKKQRALSGMENQKNTGNRAATGSAAGVTGGPAATGGHTGSTNNPSNSPSPAK